MKKLKIMATKLNDEFRNILATEMHNRFKVEVETNFNIFTMTLVTTRTDEMDFTPEQMAFMKAFEAGYTVALQMVRQEAG